MDYGGHGSIDLFQRIWRRTYQRSPRPTFSSRATTPKDRGAKIGAQRDAAAQAAGQRRRSDELELQREPQERHRHRVLL